MGENRRDGRNSQSDAPRPGDLDPGEKAASPRSDLFSRDDPGAIAARQDLSYETRLKTLQQMLADVPLADTDEHKLRRRTIQRALQMLGAEVVADEDEPEHAPKKFGYRPRE